MEIQRLNQFFNRLGGYAANVKVHAACLGAARRVVRADGLVLLVDFMAALRADETPDDPFAGLYARGRRAFLRSVNDAFVTESKLPAYAIAHRRIEREIGAAAASARQAQLAPVRRDIRAVLDDIAAAHPDRMRLTLMEDRERAFYLRFLVNSWNRSAPLGCNLWATTARAVVRGRGDRAVAFWRGISELGDYRMREPVFSAGGA